MKKIYTTPVLEIESFVTEEILDGPNILSYENGNYTAYQEGGGYITFKTGSNYILNSIDYSTFTN